MTYPITSKDPSLQPQRAQLYSSGYGFSLSGMTGTMAAALAQDAIVFAMRLDPAATVKAYGGRLHLAFTTLVAFTTPITAGRRLAVYRASGAACTGGAVLGIAKKDTDSPASQINDARIATTAALGIASVVREANPIATLDLAHVGAAGARTELIIELEPPKNPEVLKQGELIVISNPVAMDAAGTWQLAATVYWHEQVLGQ